MADAPQPPPPGAPGPLKRKTSPIPASPIVPPLPSGAKKPNTGVLKEMKKETLRISLPPRTGAGGMGGAAKPAVTVKQTLTPTRAIPAPSSLNVTRPMQVVQVNVPKPPTGSVPPVPANAMQGSSKAPAPTPPAAAKPTLPAQATGEGSMMNLNVTRPMQIGQVNVPKPPTGSVPPVPVNAMQGTAKAPAAAAPKPIPATGDGGDMTQSLQKLSLKATSKIAPISKPAVMTQATPSVPKQVGPASAAAAQTKPVAGAPVTLSKPDTQLLRGAADAAAAPQTVKMQTTKPASGLLPPKPVGAADPTEKMQTVPAVPGMKPALVSAAIPPPAARPVQPPLPNMPTAPGGAPKAPAVPSGGPTAKMNPTMAVPPAAKPPVPAPAVVKAPPPPAAPVPAALGVPGPKPVLPPAQAAAMPPAKAPPSAIPPAPVPKPGLPTPPQASAIKPPAPVPQGSAPRPGMPPLAKAGGPPVPVAPGTLRPPAPGIPPTAPKAVEASAPPPPASDENSKTAVIKTIPSKGPLANLKKPAAGAPMVKPVAPGAPIARAQPGGAPPAPVAPKPPVGQQVPTVGVPGAAAAGGVGGAVAASGLKPGGTTKPVPTVAPINVVGDPVGNYLAVGAAVASLAVLGVVLSSYLGFL